MCPDPTIAESCDREMAQSSQIGPSSFMRCSLLMVTDVGENMVVRPIVVFPIFRPYVKGFHADQVNSPEQQKEPALAISHLDASRRLICGEDAMLLSLGPAIIFTCD